MNKNMDEENKTQESVEQNQTGSSNQIDPSAGGKEGESKEQQPSKNDEGQKGTEETVSKKQYEDLEQKLGQQGEELGDYREFFKRNANLLQTLDSQPSVYNAIVSGKISEDLAKDILEGKVSVKNAEEVTKAHEEVKKELGDKKYEKTTPAELEKLVVDKVSEGMEKVTKNFSETMSEKEELQKYEDEIKEFLSSIPREEYEKLAPRMQKYADLYGETNIRTIFYAVKGEIAEEESKKQKDKEQAEAGKDLAANAAPGASQNANVVTDQNVIDQLIATEKNPNIIE